MLFAGAHGFKFRAIIILQRILIKNLDLHVPKNHLTPELKPAGYFKEIEFVNWLMEYFMINSYF